MFHEAIFAITTPNYSWFRAAFALCSPIYVVFAIYLTGWAIRRSWEYLSAAYISSALLTAVWGYLSDRLGDDGS
jgi:hypothetical protein